MVGFFVIFVAIQFITMKKAPKINCFAGGGEVPKFKTKAEHDKYYQDKGYKLDTQFNAGYYNPNDYSFDASTKRYTPLTSGASVTDAVLGTYSGPAQMYKFTAPELTPSVYKAAVEDSGRKPVFTGNKDYQTFQYADELGQYGANSKSRYFDTKTQKEVDPSKSYGDSGYNPSFVGLKKGGLVGKFAKGYDNGGNIYRYDADGNPVDAMGNVIRSTPQGNGSSNPSTSKGTSGNPYLEAGIELSNASAQYLDSKSMNANQTMDPETAAAAGFLKGSAKGASMGSAAGPYGALIGAAIGGTAGGISRYTGAKKFNRGVEFEKDSAQSVQDAERQQMAQSMALNKQLMERGLKDGGVVKGAGGPKDDAIHAKVKAGSFVVPAENAHIAKKLLKAPKKKANLNQVGGEEVRLSDGEVLIDPKDKNKIINELGEEFLEVLAPEADEDNKLATGGHVSPEEAKYKAAQKRYAELKSEEQELSSSKDKAAQTRLRDVRLQRTAIEKEYGFNNQYNNIPSKSGAAIEKALGSTGTKTAPKVGTKSTSRFIPSNMSENTDVMPPQNKTVEKPLTEQEKSLVSSAQKAEQDFDRAAIDKANKNQAYINQGLGAVKQLGGLGNYFLPYQQYKMGQEFLAKQGPRPKDKIDPDYQKAINQAQVNATYGFTPEQEALNKQSNLTALKGGVDAARLYGGGGAGSYVLSRDAGNQYYNRGLAAKVAGSNLQMSKQNLANQMLADKQNLSRNLFLDNLNAWNTNQQAGGNLVGAGIQNLISSKRLNDEMAFQREINAKSNPWTNFNMNA